MWQYGMGGTLARGSLAAIACSINANTRPLAPSPTTSINS